MAAIRECHGGNRLVSSAWGVDVVVDRAALERFENVVERFCNWVVGLLRQLLACDPSQGGLVDGTAANPLADCSALFAWSCFTISFTVPVFSAGIFLKARYFSRAALRCSGVSLLHAVKRSRSVVFVRASDEHSV